MNAPNIFLDHILQSIELIEDYTNDITREDFLNTDFIQEAVIRRLKVIGESVKNMPHDFKDKYPELPWETIANVRNILETEDCDLEVVWETVKSEIPVLKTEILKINEVKITY